jgi:hypothetical protein
MLAFGLEFGDDLTDHRARFGFRHIFDKSDGTALTIGSFPPHCYPSATLLLDRSLLIPTLAHEFSLCAFGGFPYWQCPYRSTRGKTFIGFDPQSNCLPTDELPAPE